MRASVRSISLERLARILWAAVLLTLPVTSFRYFPSGEGTYVRPLAFYPLALLLVVLAAQLLRGRMTFPLAGTWTPLAAMVLATLGATLAGALIAPPAMRGQDVIGRELRAWATLLMGVAFFGAAAWMNRDLDDLRFSLRWLFAGFVLDILWSGLQGATFYLHVLPKPLVTNWQRVFSMRELIKTNRISGLAYEPSWLAGQIATLYLPWLFAWLLTRQRVTSSVRLRICPIQNVGCSVSSQRSVRMASDSASPRARLADAANFSSATRKPLRASIDSTWAEDSDMERET